MIAIIRPPRGQLQMNPHRLMMHLRPEGVGMPNRRGAFRLRVGKTFFGGPTNS